MPGLDEDELTRLQNLSVDVMAAATAAPEDALPPMEEEVMLAVPSLVDEIRHLREALERVAQYPSPEYPFRAAAELREWARRVLAGHEA